MSQEVFLFGADGFCMFAYPFFDVGSGAAHMVLSLPVSILFVIWAFVEMVGKHSVDCFCALDHGRAKIFIAVNYDKIWSSCDRV